MTDDIERRTREREEALRADLGEQRRLARPEDYVFDKAQEAFWDLKDCTLHTEKGVDASIPQELWRVVVEERPRGAPRERIVKPSLDIMRVENDQFVEGSTWWPGRPQLIRDWFIDSSGARPAQGRRIYNQYIAPPALAHGDAQRAEPWVAHVRKLWPDPIEHESFFDYCAHMLQKPEQKCNTAIVLSGTQGIGKDAALLPIRNAVGAWNVKSIDPDSLFDTFKPWLQTLMLVINEVRPTKDEFHASSMYNILKPMIAAPPDTLPVNDKNVKLRYVVNVMRVFLTTNDFMTMYIPPEDRRMNILHSTLPKEWHIADGKENYFVELFAWLNGPGSADVAAWLKARDLSKFDPNAPPAKTSGWEAVAGTWEEPDDCVALALSKLGHPDVLLGTELLDPQFDSAEEMRAMLKSPRKIGYRMQRAGYSMLKPPEGDRWIFRHEGRVYRSRMAFVKQAAQLLNGKAIEAVRARGGKLVLTASAEPREGATAQAKRNVPF